MAAQPEGQRCENCRYGHAPLSNAPKGFVACRRYPGVRDAYGGELGGRLGYVPLMEESYWCGEYAPANPETVTEGAMTMARLVLLGDLTAARALADQLRE